MSKQSYRKWLIFTDFHTAGPNSEFYCDAEEPDCLEPGYIFPGDRYRRELWGSRQVLDDGTVISKKFVLRYHDHPPCHPEDDPEFLKDVREENEELEQWPIAA